MEREIELLADAHVSLLTERRRIAPPGLAGGGAGARGRNQLQRGRRTRPLPGKTSFEAGRGDRLRILTPGGGGWGR